ncbi:MAG: hypothetical protein AAB886_02785 [Patescibacteria group bacterium]
MISPDVDDGVDQNSKAADTKYAGCLLKTIPEYPSLKFGAPFNGSIFFHYPVYDDFNLARPPIGEHIDEKHH